jgi:hypothetical protein
MRSESPIKLTFALGKSYIYSNHSLQSLEIKIRREK